MRFTKRVVGQGHVTVPTDLRAAMGIRAGDIVEFQIVGVTRRTTPAPTPLSAPRPTEANA